MKRLLLLLIMGGLVASVHPGSSVAQSNDIKRFSLKEAQEYAVKNSYKTVNATADVQIARKKVWQTTAIGLPQINASGSYQNFIDIPTQLMPNFLTPAVDGVLLEHNLIKEEEMLPASDEKYPIQFGSRHNLSGDLTASQLLFDGTYIVGLQAAKVFVELSTRALDKSEIEVKEAVAQAYYLVLVAEENRKVLTASLEVLNKSLTETREYQKNGFLEETDVDQLQLLYTSLNNKLNMVERQIEMAGNMLQFQMGLPVSDTIELSDNLESLVHQVMAENLTSKPFDVQNHIDYKLMLTQEGLAMLNLKKDKVGYFPSLNAFITTSRNAQRNTFNFLKKDEEWYKTTIWGINLTLPIWDSGIKHFRIQQSKLELQKTRVLEKQLQEGLQLGVDNARVLLKTYTDQYASDLENMNLAKRIYEKTLIKYKEGISSSLEMTQAHNQYLASQGMYFNTTLELLNARSNMNKALNNY